ncbi:MAG: hypothetical protein NTV79_09940 [Candidatus Aureabacteria bacterium]|nr:hypothetical protein [Candidatus Auribacterota bacterium]
MKIASTTAFIIAVVLASPSPGRGQETASLKLESSLDRDTVAIGDPVTYYLKVFAPEGTKVAFPELGEKAGEIEIKSGGEGESGEGRDRRFERWYLLAAFEPGVHPLPVPEARLTLPGGREETLAASPLSLKVLSSISPSETPKDIREIKPPRELPVSYLIPVLIVLGALAVLAAGVVLVRFLRRPKAETPPPPARPAHEIAYEELRRIKAEDLPARGLVQEFYVRVSNVVRHYLENRFALHSPERTTEEFLTEMATTDALSLKHQELVGDFLAHCDLVKFARYGPAPRQIENVYDSAVTLVDETKPREETKAG